MTNTVATKTAPSLDWGSLKAALDNAFSKFDAAHPVHALCAPAQRVVLRAADGLFGDEEEANNAHTAARSAQRDMELLGVEGAIAFQREAALLGEEAALRRNKAVLDQRYVRASHAAEALAIAVRAVWTSRGNPQLAAEWVAHAVRQAAFA